MKTLVDCRLFARIKSLTVDSLAIDIRRALVTHECQKCQQLISAMQIEFEPSSFCQLIA